MPSRKGPARPVSDLHQTQAEETADGGRKPISITLPDISNNKNNKKAPLHFLSPGQGYDASSHEDFFFPSSESSGLGTMKSKE